MSLCYTGLADVDEYGNLKLTSDGELFLKTKSPRLLLKNLENKVWGFREIRETLSKKPMKAKEIVRELRKLGSGWRSTTQPNIRLRFLTLLGAVEVFRKKYRWVNILPTHGELKRMLAELGSLLGYATSEEYKVGPIRIDVVWQRDARPESAVVYAFEVHTEGQVKSAVYNLQECIRRWSPRKCYVVTNERQLAEVKGAIEPLPTLERSKLDVLTDGYIERMLLALKDVQNMLREKDILLNTLLQ